MNERYFHFTLGPVQSFVAQARRTRDFWAGSFLLSWLSAVAIKAVQAQDGIVSFPIPEKNYLAWLTNDKYEGGYKKEPAPQQGCIPNRFKGLVAKVPKDFKPEDVVNSVKDAWESLAEAVWKNDLEDLKDRPEETKKIWTRQVENFWEISWVLEDESEKNFQLSATSEPLLEKEGMPKEILAKLTSVFNKKVKGKDKFLKEIEKELGAADTKKYENLILKYASKANLLDRRKNWRSYLPPEEAGVKCMMMDGWQELSATPTPNRDDLDKFWETGLREKGKDRSLENDLRKGEYLCAIAFIKRRFAHCFNDFSKKMPGDWTVHGWKVNPAVPSVSYMAAAPWLAKVLTVAPIAELSAFHEAAKVLTNNYYGEYDTRLDCLDEALMKRSDKGLFWKVKSLDGDVFFEAALDNKNRHEDQVQAQKVKKALLALRKAVNKELETKQEKLEQVSPFYAVLMMDGDSLGVQMSDTQKQTAISESLNYFTEHVLGVVEKNSGFLIYAGGDDVLALLPLEYALNCAYQLRVLYLESFEKKGGYTVDDKQETVKSTLSGAIEYAHIKMPLGKVLGDAHHLLDDIAKEGCGRDSIAVRVWKPGGQHLQWARPWKCAIKGGKVVIDQLAEDYRKINSDTPFSNSFFFNIEERFVMLQGFRKKDIVQLIAAEYLNSGVNDKRKPKMGLKEAKMKVIPLVRQCMPVKRIVEDGRERFEPLKKLDTDAAHLIRFLVNKGVE